MTSLAIPANPGFECESPLKPAIRAAFAALTTDYGEKFTRQFRTVGDDGVKPITPDRWQYRLLHSLSGMEDMPGVVVEAVNAIAKRCGNCPTLVEIVAECRTLRAAKYRAADERREAEHRTALPPPSRSASPGEIAGMMREAFSAESSGRNSGAEERDAWLERKRHKALAHEQLIAAHKSAGNIRSRLLHADPRCAIGGCGNPGTLSHSTQGTSEWYCREHFRA